MTGEEEDTRGIDLRGTSIIFPCSVCHPLCLLPTQYASTVLTCLPPPFSLLDQKPLVGKDRRSTCCLCCQQNVVQLRSSLERTAYCCGESIRFKADIDNQSEESVRLRLRLTQVSSCLLLFCCFLTRDPPVPTPSTREPK
jgi:hypothetical protein